MTSFPTPSAAAAPTSLTRAELPARPLKMQPNAIAGTRGQAFLIVILLAIGGFLAWWQAPGLLRDWQISRNPVYADYGDIQNGKCTTRKAIFTDCEAHLAYTHDGKDYASDVQLMFVDIHSGDYTVDLVISGDRPELATLSLGIDMLWNRIIVLGLFLLFTIGGAFAILLQGRRARRLSRAFEVPGRMLLTPVELGVTGHARGTAQVAYFDRAGQGKKARQLMAEFPRGTSPMLLADANGLVSGLAVRHEGVAVPALLDSGLTRLDLTPEERSAMLAVIAEEQAARGHVMGEEPKKSWLGKTLRGVLTFFGIILFFVLAALGWWLWYVTGSTNKNDPLGMEINNIMPEAVNTWACSKLEARFGDQNAPFGCTRPDHVSWK